MIQIAVVDDELQSCEIIKNYLNQWQEETKIPFHLTCFHDGDEFLNQILTCCFDIVFMDVFMPLLNGMETAKEMRKTNQNIKLVFITTSRDFAIESYSVKADNYFLKPVSYLQVKQLLDETILDLGKEQKSLLLKTIDGYQKIYFNQIEFIEAYNKNVQVYTTNQGFIKILEPLYQIESLLLKEKQFFKCHRSYIVNMETIEFFNKKDIQTKSQQLIPIARGMAKSFEDAYFAFMFN